MTYGIAIDFDMADLMLANYRSMLDPEFKANARTDVITGFHVMKTPGLGWIGWKSELIPLVEKVAQTRAKADVDAISQALKTLTPTLKAMQGQPHVVVTHDGSILYAPPGESLFALFADPNADLGAVQGALAGLFESPLPQQAAPKRKSGRTSKKRRA